MNWLDEVLSATRESESPRRYYYWSALAAISAVVNNKVWLDKHYYLLYPNVYVMLIGPSGIRKGPPVAMAKNLVEAVRNTRTIAGRGSIQAIISQLATAYTRPGEPPVKDAIAGMFSSELASFIIQDPQALTILTDLYDGHYNKAWTNFTKVSGSEKLVNVCLTWLAASNEVHFKDAIPDNALGGGLIARTFIVFEEKPACINSLTDKPEVEANWTELAEYLKTLTKLKGTFKWSDEGKGLYNEWYHEFRRTKFEDPTGSLNRIHDHILKVAMLTSLAHGTDMVLKQEDIQEAIKVCIETVPGVKRVAMVTSNGNGSPSGPGLGLVLKELLSREPDDKGRRKISHARLLSKYFGHFDTFELQRIAESLQAQGAIRIDYENTPGVSGREPVYILNNRVYERFKKITGDDN